MSSAKIDVLWSPIESDKFITFGSDLRLYQVEEDTNFKETPERLTISEKTSAVLLSVNIENQYMKCVAWCPKPEIPFLLAIGQANGKVILTSFGHSSDNQELVGKEFVPKHPRQCNCVAWNPEETNLLVAGLDKNRSDQAILVWDVNRPPINSYSDNYGPTTERRHSSLGYSHNNTESPGGNFSTYTELGFSDSCNSIKWFANQPKTLISGMNNKHLKIFDLRDCSKPQNTTPTKSVYGVCVDPYFDHRLASFFENQVTIWDIRNFEKPVITLNEAKPVIKIAWSSKRSNLLGSLCKESSTLKLYDIQQAPANSDDIEPTVVERTIKPHGSQSLSSFSWHPFQENRLLTIAPNHIIHDYTVFDRITINWAPTSELIWTHGKKLLQCIDNRNKLFECLDDISVKMKIRAQMGYGQKTQQLWHNGDVTTDDSQLHRLWMWLDIVKSLREEGRLKMSSRNPSNDVKYEGVRNIICSDVSVLGHSATWTKSEEVLIPWQGLERLGAPKILVYKSEDRDRAIQLCGWGNDLEGNALSILLERLEIEHQHARAAAIAVFNLKLRRAIQILGKGAVGKPYGDSNLNFVAMALSGYTEERHTLWTEMCRELRPKLTNPYLKAMFAFLTSDPFSVYDDVLEEKGLEVRDKVAFACMFLPDSKLAEYLDKLAAKMIDVGDLDGFLLTGLTQDGLTLLQSFVDRTGDVQTASLVVLQSGNSILCQDQKSLLWVESYRLLLDSWRLWEQRCLFDVQWYKANPSLYPLQQVYVRCNYCGKSISSHLQQLMGQQPGNRNFSRLNLAAANKGKVRSCPGCRKPLPRCALCLTNLGTPSGTSWKQLGQDSERDNHMQQQQKLSKFSDWFTWCQTCRHGGHATHIVEWFREHSECPVSGCTCKCMMMDSGSGLNSSN